LSSSQFLEVKFNPYAQQVAWD